MTWPFEVPDALIVAGGIGQVFTAIIYPWIRHAVFDWYTDIRQLKPLNQEIAKTYGRYIQGLNFGFGIIALLFTGELQNGTGLAVALTTLIAAYWTGKVITQFAYYPMYQIPRKTLFRIGEVGMNALFLFFAGLFLLLAAGNLTRYLSA